jgi:hypothetical protein
MVDSIQASRLSNQTPSSSRTLTKSEESLIPTVVLSETKPRFSEAVLISEEAKSKFTNELDALKFVRRIQAQPETSTPNNRLAELKERFKTPEGIAQYLDSVDNEAIANTMLQNKVL